MKDQWLGNYLTPTGALHMDCDSFDFRSLSDSQMHKSPVEGDEEFKYLLMASDIVYNFIKCASTLQLSGT